MKTIKPDCPTASVVGLVKVTLPVMLMIKFWKVEKFNVNEPDALFCVLVDAIAVGVVMPFVPLSEIAIR